jgi:mannose-6-phosphate isomerase-like protein (cupin superfamily)
VNEHRGAAAHCNRHFSFQQTSLEHVSAHDGRGSVYTKRAYQAPDLGVNFVDLTVVPVNSEIGIHTHALDNQEIYVIISGRAHMTLDGAEFSVGPGDVVINRPGGTHSLQNSGDSEVRMVVIEHRVPSGQ